MRLLIGLVVLTSMLFGDVAARADDPLASPESVGFSSAGLKSFQQAMRALVDEHRLAGVTTLVARHGKVVHFDAYGVQDLDAKKPIAKDTIFRIASMTKPITGVAMMMLWEEGQVDARRSGREAHSRVRRTEGRRPPSGHGAAGACR